MGSTAMHPSGSVVGTCSGQRGALDFNEGNSYDSDGSDNSYDNVSDEESSVASTSSDRIPDNTLKVWSVL